MKNNIIGTFTEETFLYGKVFTLIQDIKTKPCTEEEKRIYGVNIRLDLDAEYQRARIAEYNCEDGGVFYKTWIDWEFGGYKSIFQDLNNAKEFLIKTAKEKNFYKTMENI